MQVHNFTKCDFVAIAPPGTKKPDAITGTGLSTTNNKLRLPLTCRHRGGFGKGTWLCASQS